MGGEHSEDNLILLCPNHHRMAHSGEISAEELKERKSTHIKGDRLTGDFKTTVSDLKIYMCRGTAINTPTLLSHNNYPILKIYTQNDNILVDAKFFNRNGVLVLWMSRSMYWSHTNAEISQPKIDFLEIKNANESVYLKIQKATTEDALKVEMTTYLAGNLITCQIVKDGLSTFYRGRSAGGYHCCFLLSSYFIQKQKIILSRGQ